jgi:hypothetical protein
MRTLPFPLCRDAGLAVLFVLLSGGWAQAAVAGKTNTAASRATNATVATVAAEAPIPRSTFVMPKSAKEGRDPFFPNSTRLFGETTTTKTNAPTTNAGLVLKALAGSAERRLATINTRTFEVGEEAEVQTGAGRVRVRCLEINDDSVVIEVGGTRRTLRMRASFLTEP